MGQRPNPAEVYEDFVVREQFRPFTEELLARAAPQPGERVLDLACATGGVARLVAPHVAPGGGVTGLDVSPAMLAVARARAAAEGVAVTWCCGDAVALPYADGAFDLAFCQQGLQFFPDKPAALRELRRALAPGGRALLSTWAPLDHSPVVAAFNHAVERHLGVAPLATPFSLTDAGAVRALLAGAGFADVAVAPVELTLRYPDLGEFVRRYLPAVAAIAPALAALPPAALAAAARRIEVELTLQVGPYLDGDGLRNPRRTHVAVARCPGLPPR